MSLKNPKKEEDSPLVDFGRGKETPKTDFDRNRDGLYGGLPKARDDKSPRGDHPPARK
ncbi:MAG: hypothetical protein JOZ13_12125 [Alphaproteobacteria bacterium]|nr:hypothetical protein [Alphaproteobacteria bacterium]